MIYNLFKFILWFRTKRPFQVTVRAKPHDICIVWIILYKCFWFIFYNLDYALHDKKGYRQRSDNHFLSCHLTETNIYNSCIFSAQSSTLSQFTIKSPQQSKRGISIHSLWVDFSFLFFTLLNWLRREMKKSC